MVNEKYPNDIAMKISNIINIRSIVKTIIYKPKLVDPLLSALLNSSTFATATSIFPVNSSTFERASSIFPVNSLTFVPVSNYKYLSELS